MMTTMEPSFIACLNRKIPVGQYAIQTKSRHKQKTFAFASNFALLGSRLLALSINSTRMHLPGKWSVELITWQLTEQFSFNVDKWSLSFEVDKQKKWFTSCVSLARAPGALHRSVAWPASHVFVIEKYKRAQQNETKTKQQQNNKKKNQRKIATVVESSLSHNSCIG